MASFINIDSPVFENISSSRDNEIDELSSRRPLVSINTQDDDYSDENEMRKPVFLYNVISLISKFDICFNTIRMKRLTVNDVN